MYAYLYLYRRLVSLSRDSSSPSLHLHLAHSVSHCCKIYFTFSLKMLKKSLSEWQNRLRYATTNANDSDEWITNNTKCVGYYLSLAKSEPRQNNLRRTKTYFSNWPELASKQFSTWLFSSLSLSPSTRTVSQHTLIASSDTTHKPTMLETDQSKAIHIVQWISSNGGFCKIRFPLISSACQWLNL